MGTQERAINEWGPELGHLGFNGSDFITLARAGSELVNFPQIVGPNSSLVTLAKDILGL